MKWKKWLHGLLGAVVSGAATAVGAVAGMVGSGETHMDAGAVTGAAVGGAITGAVLYLKQSPVPPDASNGARE